VPLCDEAHRQQLDHVTFPLDHVLDVAGNRIEPLSELRDLIRGKHVIGCQVHSPFISSNDLTDKLYLRMHRSLRRGRFVIVVGVISRARLVDIYFLTW